MTEEQIAAVRVWVDGPYYDDGDREAVKRLLDERRVLLEAAALVMKGRHCDEAVCTHRACCQAAIARTATAFAEEAAP